MNAEQLESVARREQERQERYRARLLCCASTACLAAGSTASTAAIRHAVAERRLGDEIEVVETGCLGPCSRGPVLLLQSRAEPDRLYQQVAPAVGAEIVADLAIPNGAAEQHRLPADLPFLTRQVKVALSNAGRIDPERLEDSLAHGGYSALARVLRELTPEQVCEEIRRSGLRGRGGAGYPTGLKWRFLREAPGPLKLVVANGDEGDPGAFMDRTLMDSDPHRVLEGLAIAAYATGASRAFLYVRGEYPIAVRRLQKAIRMAERHGLLGTSVLGTGFCLRAEVRIGAGAFVCGEETALMASVEGRRGTPRMRPPYPTEHGLWGYPTMIQNVETLACVPPIMTRGADWFASLGTEKSTGTKTFALSGKLRNTGLIEVPLGITLREIVEQIGGGVPDGHAFKAAQTGGPSGGCIPAAYLDTPVDYDSLKALGSIMGSGGLVVMDDRSCMPDVAKFFMDFCRDESCGKCAPCRIGTQRLYELLDRITTGRGTTDDLARLESLCETVSQASLCGLGQSAPNPVLSTLRYFRDEYEAHILERRCPAGVCRFERAGGSRNGAEELTVIADRVAERGGAAAAQGGKVPS